MNAGLTKEQFVYFSKIIGKFSRKEPFILEAGTAWGKTVLGGAVAEKFQDKNVIICTENNQLVDGFLNEIASGPVKFKFKKEIQVVIGKHNYIDPDKADNVCGFFREGELKKYLAEAEKRAVINKKTKTKSYNSKDYLFENIFKTLHLIDEGAKKTVIDLSAQAKRLAYAGDLEGPGVKITNYYYLLLAAMFFKKDFTDSVLILDEVDTILNTAVSLFTESFSLFSFKNTVLEAIKVLKLKQERGVKNALKSMGSLLKEINNTLSSAASPHLIKTGSFYSNTDIFKRTRDKIFKLNGLTVNNSGIKFLIKQKYTEDVFEILNEQVKNLKLVSSNNLYAMYLNFSPIKGYPSFDIVKEPVGARLASFWKKAGAALLMSATCSAGVNKKYLFEKLYLSDSVFPPVVSAKSQFNRTKCRVFLPDMASPDVKEDKNGIEFLSDAWIDFYIPFIVSSNTGKNTLVLAGSYKDVEKIAEAMRPYTAQNIIKAEAGMSKIEIIGKFKTEGGILIVPRHYGRGVNLPGEQVEKLYICRLPYNPPNDISYVGLSAGKRISRMRDDMLNTLEQMVGRLIRTRDDEGEIYILDNRVYDENISAGITTIINRHGVCLHAPIMGMGSILSANAAIL